MEEIEGRSTAAAYEALVLSAREAHFTMLRVWGGGIFMYESFYDAMDRCA